jgi:serine/threonine protein kinase
VQDFYKNHKNICKPSSVPSSINSSKATQSKKSPLDDYEITSQVLGSGSYGEVKLIKHKSSSELFALKQINKKVLEEEKTSPDLILREISVHKSLSHPNIIKLIDSFEDSTNIFIILEYASQGNLFELIKSQVKLKESIARKIHRQAVEAVKYLNENSIVHRDIKPENVLISEEMTVKLCDFGWCVKGEELRSTFCGTLDYMAPEMVRSQKHSHEVDVWALGVLLFEMTHGYPPFQGSRDSEKLFNIVNCNFQFAEWVSNNAHDLIQKMIQKDPKKRIKVKEIDLHPFYQEVQFEMPMKVGDSFRYYVPGYGMDDGILITVGPECQVFFQKSKKKIELNSEEILRRLQKKGKNEIGDSGSSEKIKKGLVAERIEKYEVKVEKRDVLEKPLKFFNIKGVENSYLSDNRSFQNSPNNSFSKFLSANESLASSLSERKNTSSSKNLSKPIPTHPKVPVLLNLKKERPLNDSMLSLNERLELLAQSRSEIDSKDLKDSSSENSKNLKKQEIPETVNYEKLPIEESIYSNLNEWIRTPVRRKKKRQRPQNNLNLINKDRSLDKQIEKFKGKFVETASVSLAETPVVSPRVPLTSRKLESLIEDPESEDRTEKSIKEPSEGLYKKITSNAPDSLEFSKDLKSSDDSENFEIGSQKNGKEQESRFVSLLRERMEQKKFFPFPVEKMRNSVDLNESPLFPELSVSPKPVIKVSRMSSSSNSFSDPGTHVFDKKEKNSVMSFMPSQEDMNHSEAPMTPRTLMRSNARKQCKKIENFEERREKIEEMHDKFYFEADDHWEQKKTIVKAQDVSDEELEEEQPKRTFSEFDHVLINSPSFVPLDEEKPLEVEKNNQKLKHQKRNLEEMILNMDKVEPRYLRRIARPKKKGGFFNWLGTFMGCSERY